MTGIFNIFSEGSLTEIKYSDGPMEKKIDFESSNSLNNSKTKNNFGSFTQNLPPVRSLAVNYQN